MVKTSVCTFVSVAGELVLLPHAAAESRRSVERRLSIKARTPDATASGNASEIARTESLRRPLTVNAIDLRPVARQVETHARAHLRGEREVGTHVVLPSA